MAVSDEPRGSAVVARGELGQYILRDARHLDECAAQIGLLPKTFSVMEAGSEASIEKGLTHSFLGEAVRVKVEQENASRFDLIAGAPLTASELNELNMEADNEIDELNKEADIEKKNAEDALQNEEAGLFYEEAYIEALYAEMQSPEEQDELEMLVEQDARQEGGEKSVSTGNNEATVSSDAERELDLAKDTDDLIYKAVRGIRLSGWLYRLAERIANERYEQRIEQDAYNALGPEASPSELSAYAATEREELGGAFRFMAEASNSNADVARQEFGLDVPEPRNPFERRQDILDAQVPSVDQAYSGVQEYSADGTPIATALGHPNASDVQAYTADGKLIASPLAASDSSIPVAHTAQVQTDSFWETLKSDLKNVQEKYFNSPAEGEKGWSEHNDNVLLDENQRLLNERQAALGREPLSDTNCERIDNRMVSTRDHVHRVANELNTFTNESRDRAAQETRSMDPNDPRAISAWAAHHDRVEKVVGASVQDAATRQSTDANAVNMHELAVQYSAARDAPAQNTPVPSAQVQNTAAQNAPVQNIPAQNTPAQNTPAPNTPVPSAPVQNTAAQNTPAPKSFPGKPMRVGEGQKENNKFDLEPDQHPKDHPSQQSGGNQSGQSGNQGGSGGQVLGGRGVLDRMMHTNPNKHLKPEARANLPQGNSDSAGQSSRGNQNNAQAGGTVGEGQQNPFGTTLTPSGAISRSKELREEQAEQHKADQARQERQASQNLSDSSSPSSSSSPSDTPSPSPK